MGPNYYPSVGWRAKRVASRASMRAGDLIDAAEKTLVESKYVDHWQKGRERIEAEELLDFVLDRVPDDDDEIPAPAARRYRTLVAKRATGMPVPQITGFMEFRG